MSIFDIDFSKIKNAEIQYEPFPHFVIKDFFASFHLRSIREGFPKSKIEQSKMTSKSRYTIVYESEYFKELMQENLVWNQFYKQMSSDLFKEIIRDKYEETANFAGDMSDIDLKFQMDITFAKRGYTRSIHLDRGFHFFNSFIYLNGRDEFGGEGGELQLHEVAKGRGLYDKFPETNRIESTKIIEIESNTFVGFFCCPWSYHSVVPMRGNNNTRDFIYCALNEANEKNLWPEAVVLSEKRRKKFILE